MRINKFELWVNQSLIREIPFKDGLNIITNEINVGRSGNSVGKSTLSRVIDYLFLGSIESIYVDEEFGKPNEQIENLFETSSVSANLFFSDIRGLEHTISRNLVIGDKEKTYSFDNEKVTESEYQKKILSSFFGVESSRPSLRFLAPKFIRNSSHRMLNTTKFLDKHTSDKDYSELFLFLFGFDDTELLTEKRNATNKVNSATKIRKALNILVRTQNPNPQIKELKKSVENLERSLFDIQVGSSAINPIEKLSELSIVEESTSKLLLSIDRKIENINQTVEYLSQEGGNSLVSELNFIYHYARARVENVVEDFENVLAFHDNLVSRKKQFLTIDLPELETTKRELIDKLNHLNDEKKEIFASIKSNESLENLTNKIKYIGELKITLGKIEGLVEQQKSADLALTHATNNLNEILGKIAVSYSSVEKFQVVFNKFLSNITNTTHGEKYSFNLDFDKAKGTCGLKINSSVSNPEGGKKKTEVIAFDFAYIFSIFETKIKRPSFVFHDGIEEIDHKQIDQIFTIAQQMPGQQIVAILADKLSKEIYNKYYKNIILELSETNMFFKV